MYHLVLFQFTRISVSQTHKLAVYDIKNENQFNLRLFNCSQSSIQTSLLGTPATTQPSIVRLRIFPNVDTLKERQYILSQRN